MTTRVLLIRHGQTNWNLAGRWQGHSDIPLNGTGRTQATALAHRLRNWEVQAIYSSDLSRAAETATIIGQVLGLSPQIHLALRERFGGAFEGLTSSEIAARFPDAWAKLQQGILDIPGGENGAKLSGRIMPAFEEWLICHEGQTFALITHAGLLRVLISNIIGLDSETSDRLSVGGNTGLSIIQVAEHGHRRLSLLNDTAHLEFLANITEAA